MFSTPGCPRRLAREVLDGGTAAVLPGLRPSGKRAKGAEEAAACMRASGGNALSDQPVAVPGGCQNSGAPAPATGGADTLTRVADIYREQSTNLVRQLARRTGCIEVARDLAQEAFVRFLRLPAWRAGQIEHPEAYLRRISTNLLRDWGRSRSGQREAETRPDPLELHFDQVAVLESRDTLRRLEIAVSRLKPKTRAIFLAHRLDGLTYLEIAGLTGLSVKGVEKQMSKAIAKIDRLLDRS